MSNRFQFASRKERLAGVLSAAWFVLSLIWTLYVAEDEGLYLYETLILFSLLMAPVAIYWAVSWIKHGEPTNEKPFEPDLLNEQPKLVVPQPLRGLQYRAHIFMIFSVMLILGLISDLLVNQYLVGTIQRYGYGSVPADVVSEIEQWSSFAEYARLISLFGISITFISSYIAAKRQLEVSGVTGLACTAPLLVLWFFIPIANLFMPWRALGSLDRAACFACLYGRGGELWRDKKFMSISWRAAFMGVAFFLSGMYSIVSNIEFKSLSQRMPIGNSGAIRIIEKSSELIIPSIFLVSVLLLTMWIFINTLNRRLIKINESVSV
jgi:hypothetical protein